MKGDTPKDNFTKVKNAARKIVTFNSGINLEKYPKLKSAKNADLFRKGNYKELVKGNSDGKTSNDICRD